MAGYPSGACAHKSPRPLRRLARHIVVHLALRGWLGWHSAFALLARIDGGVQ